MQKVSFKVVLAVALFFALSFAAGNLRAQTAAPDSAKAASAAPSAASAQAAKQDLSVESADSKIVEDVSTPSLKGSGLVAIDPIVGQIGTNDPAFTRELTRVQWRAADPIDLYIIKPTGVAKPPVVLYLYSYPFEMDRFNDDNFCKFLTSQGVAAVGFASALTAGRYHDVPMKEWFVSKLSWSMAASAHDVQMILNYLATRGDLDMDHVGMFGDGSGASIAILAAAVDPRIKALDLLDPWGDWPDWIAKSTRIPENERPDYQKPEFLAGVAPLDPVKWLPELKTQKVRLREVNSVTVTPSEARKKIEAAAPPNVQIIRYADNDAFTASVIDGSGFDWVKDQVRPAASPQYRATGGAQPQDNAGKPKESQQ